MKPRDDVKSLLKTIDSKVQDGADLTMFLEDLEQVTANRDEPDDDIIARVGVPYVNADPIGSTEWK